MVHILKKRIIILAVLLFAAFIFFVLLKSKSGVILFSDNNFSLWKDNLFLSNPYVWHNNEYGFFNPLSVINLPIQFFFKFFTFFASVYFISALYFYGAVIFLFFSSMYLIKKVNKNAKLQDYLVVSIFSISSPIIASITLLQIDVAFSFAFVYLFLGYLFSCKERGAIEVRDLLILSVMIPFINTYFYNTILLAVTLSVYFLIFNFKYILKNKARTFLFLLVFALLNIFWYIVPFHQALFNRGNLVAFYSEDLAMGVLEGNSEQVRHFSPFMNSNNYTSNIDHSDYFWSTSYIVLASFAITVMVFFLVFIFRRKTDRGFIYFCVCVYLFFYPLSLGIRGPFKDVFLLVWNNVPGFNIFRSIYKFQFVMYFIFVIMLIMMLKEIKKRGYIKIFLLAMVLILSTNYVLNPFRSRLTNPYKIPDYYFKNEIVLKNKKLINIYKVIPDKPFGYSFIYTSFDWDPNDWDSANILKYFTNQNTAFVPFNASNIDKNIREQLCYKEFKTNRDISLVTKIAAFFNIKHFIMQNDVRAKNISCLESVKEYKLESIGKLDVYSIDSNYFLPHFYTSKNNIISQRTINELLRIISQDDWQVRSAVFFEVQNSGKSDKLESLLNKKEIVPTKVDGDQRDEIATSLDAPRNDMTLEFKKINPTKYRVRVHSASGVFPVVFSESFHDGWKAYLAKPSNDKFPMSNAKSIFNDQISKYKILDGNEDDQATKEELNDFVQEGLITDLGNNKEKTVEHKKWNSEKQKEESDYVEKYSVDFVSKNFQGTIQNDNLPEGHFWETLFRKPIDDESHLMVNGYANSWIIDTEKVCKDNSPSNYCIKNADGSYDMEMVVEFWPQRLFYVGAGISVTTLLICLAYLGYDWRKRRKGTKMIKLNS